MNSFENKIVVLIFVGYYLPGYRGGGPIRSIANMVDRLGSEFDFRIITTDRDLGELHSYQSIKVDEWNKVGKAHVFYTSPASRTIKRIAQLMCSTHYDVLYLNSAFNIVFTFKPLLVQKFGSVPPTPIVVAPRGEFSQGAFNLKRWKKVPFMRFLLMAGLLDKVRWHASTEFEATDIQRVIGLNIADRNSFVTVASDLSASVDVLSKDSSTDGKGKAASALNTLRVCFLSRISPMKNLDYALKVLLRVKVLLQFDIYGPKESSEYWAECKQLISQLPPNIQVSYIGSVENSRVCSVIANYDLFFVPSRGENFGFVFIEALSAGVPILVSDRTPWRDLQAQNLGWDIALEQPEAFVQAVHDAAAFDATKRAEMRRCCIAFARNKAEDREDLNMNRNLFLTAATS